jgi:tetratricopeptide (TPR) repeat protein
MQRLAQELGDAARGAWAAQGLAVCALLAGRTEEGLAGLREALVQMQAAGDRNGIVFCQVYRVLGLVDLQQFEAARSTAEQALEGARDGASITGAAYAHGALGYAAWAQRDLDAARAHMEAALQLATRLRLVRGQARAESGLARILLDLGDVGAATAHFQRALAILVDCALHEILADTLIGVALALMHRQQADASVRVMSAAERAVERTGRLAPRDRTQIAELLADAARALPRGVYELAITEGRMLAPRDAALYALEVLEAGAASGHAEARAAGLRRVV